jgi:hypothetical protein
MMLFPMSMPTTAMAVCREDYERCHPGETLDDLKNRSRFLKDDKGLLRDWMEIAAMRAAAKAKLSLDQNRTAITAFAA